MIQASCHCGNVSLSIQQPPRHLVSCNCSICLRIAAQWGYFLPEDIQLTIKQANTVAYQWGDKNIDFHHCPQCGCTTHYIPTKQSGREKMAVNFSMVDKADREEVNIKYFDGADTWQFIEPACEG